MADEGVVNWTIETEVNLFHAMRSHKPVGVNRHFQMMCITNKLHDSISKKMTAKHIWDHLGKMYDLTALNESEILPFPNREKEFVLPSQDYASLIEKDFPRTSSEVLPTNEPNSAIKSALKAPIASSVPPSIISTPVAEDSPKRERKRTRQAASTTTASPASADNTPAKRVRRT